MAGCLGLAGVVGFVGTTFAGLPDDREATMKHIVRAFRDLVSMSKSGKFDAAVAGKQGQSIAASLEKFKDLFPDGSQSGDKNALPAIWSDHTGFEAARVAALNAAVSVTKATDAATYQQAFQALGGTCKSCHDKFRSAD